MLSEDGSITLYLLDNDSNATCDSITLSLTSQPAHGTLVQNADNSCTYTPMVNWSGVDSFTYALFDGTTWSDVATVRLTVTAVADAPTLVLTDVTNPPRELFRTSWATVANKDSTSTLVQKSELEGWKLVTSGDTMRGGRNGFEIWSAGDKMADANRTLHSVSAAPKDGRNWLELNDAASDMPQTLGIERAVDTVAGASYTLTLDAAGRLGYSADYTRIAIYVDGQKIGGWSGTSGTAALNWQALSFRFTGKGGTQTIRIVTDATRVDADGRGTMIDNIALVEVLPSRTGLEDSIIRLSSISAALKDTYGSETLKLEITALPARAVVSDGRWSFTAALAYHRRLLTN